MSAFQQVLKTSAKAARRVVVLPPSAFAETYSRRPTTPVKIGLRSVSDTEAAAAQRMAHEAAWEAFSRPADGELRLELFNDHLMTNVLARACVQDLDAMAPFFAPSPEVLIREALTPGGVRRLWEEFERMQIADAPCSPEASDEEMAAFGRRLVDGLGSVAPERAERVRKLVRAALPELEV